jgi:hypothetical protein
MMRWFRRLFLLGVLAGGGYAGYQVLRRRRSYSGGTAHPLENPPATRWPPLSTEPIAKSAPEPAPRWVVPVNGDCPDGYPLKANDNSGIFHVPGGRFYARTVAERCYANADDAVADGYRPAKA